MSNGNSKTNLFDLGKIDFSSKAIRDLFPDLASSSVSNTNTSSGPPQAGHSSHTIDTSPQYVKYVPALYHSVNSSASSNLNVSSAAAHAGNQAWKNYSTYTASNIHTNYIPGQYSNQTSYQNNQYQARSKTPEVAGYGLGYNVPPNNNYTYPATYSDTRGSGGHGQAGGMVPPALLQANAHLQALAQQQQGHGTSMYSAPAQSNGYVGGTVTPSVHHGVVQLNPTQHSSGEQRHWDQIMQGLSQYPVAQNRQHFQNPPDASGTPRYSQLSSPADQSFAASHPDASTGGREKHAPAPDRGHVEARSDGTSGQGAPVAQQSSKPKYRPSGYYDQTPYDVERGFGPIQPPQKKSALPKQSAPQQQPAPIIDLTADDEQDLLTSTPSGNGVDPTADNDSVPSTATQSGGALGDQTTTKGIMRTLVDGVLAVPPNPYLVNNKGPSKFEEAAAARKKLDEEEAVKKARKEAARKQRKAEAANPLVKKKKPAARPSTKKGNSEPLAETPDLSTTTTTTPAISPAPLDAKEQKKADKAAASARMKAKGKTVNSADESLAQAQRSALDEARERVEAEAEARTNEKTVKGAAGNLLQQDAFAAARVWDLKPKTDHYGSMQLQGFDQTFRSGALIAPPSNSHLPAMTGPIASSVYDTVLPTLATSADQDESSDEDDAVQAGLDDIADYGLGSESEDVELASASIASSSETNDRPAKEPKIGAPKSTSNVDQPAKAKPKPIDPASLPEWVHNSRLALPGQRKSIPAAVQEESDEFDDLFDDDEWLEQQTADIAADSTHLQTPASSTSSPPDISSLAGKRKRDETAFSQRIYKSMTTQHNGTTQSSALEP